MAARGLNDGSSMVGQIIREYRKARGVTQKQFAGALGVEARTLRMYENGERTLENITDLRRIADLLEIDPAELGLAARTISAPGAEEIDALVEQAASLIQQARLIEAQTMVEALLRDLKKQRQQEDAPFLRALASAHCIAGQVRTFTSKTREVAQMMQHYQEMETLAQELEDQTLLALAQAFRGDLLRRRGDVALAIGSLEKVRASYSLAGAQADGTIALLLGRVHLANGDINGFEDELARAVEIAQRSGIGANAVLTQFSLGSVYAEYARGYGRLGKLEQSQQYLHLAEAHLPMSNLWSLLFKATQAEALVYAGDIPMAMPLLIEVAHLAQMYGHQLLIERLYRLQYHLEDQVSLFRKASRSLSDVLYGPIEP